MLIKKISTDDGVYTVSVHRSLRDCEHDPSGRDDTKMCVLAIANDRTPALVSKVRCSIAGEAWSAARDFRPADADILDFYAERAVDLGHPPGTECRDLFVDMSQYTLWEEHLRDRRALKP